MKTLGHDGPQQRRRRQQQRRQVVVVVADNDDSCSSDVAISAERIITTSAAMTTTTTTGPATTTNKWSTIIKQQRHYWSCSSIGGLFQTIVIIGICLLLLMLFFCYNMMMMMMMNNLQHPLPKRSFRQHRDGIIVRDHRVVYNTPQETLQQQQHQTPPTTTTTTRLRSRLFDDSSPIIMGDILENEKLQPATTTTTTRATTSAAGGGGQYQQHHQWNTTTTTATTTTTTKKKGYLIFQPPRQILAQGIGNILNGLLAVHYLGIEFHRHVCLFEQDWPEFFQAFSSVSNNDNNNNEHLCTTIKTSQQYPSSSTPWNTIWLVNFAKLPMNECDLRNRLLNYNEEPILYIVGNTYPRWPTVIMHPTATTINNNSNSNNNHPLTEPRTMMMMSSIGVQSEQQQQQQKESSPPISLFELETLSFHDFYQPTPALLDILPWNDNQNNHDDDKMGIELPSISVSGVVPSKTSSSSSSVLLSSSLSPPTTVVHLRQADGPQDVRAGLDVKTLETLGQTLPNTSTFLVTNQIANYQYFEQHFGWKHPPWTTAIHHSALPHLHWEPPTTSRNLLSNNPSLSQKTNNISSTSRRRNMNNTTISQTQKKNGGEEVSSAHFPQQEVPTKSTGSRHIQPVRQQQQQQKRDLSSSSSESSLQMWSDWYTLLHAKQVYHTHSDFSLSAVHWNRIGQQESYTIRGINAMTQRLDLGLPPWIHVSTNDDFIHNNNNNNNNDSDMFQQQSKSSSTKKIRIIPPLSHRTADQLLHCDLYPSGLNGIANVLDLDDEYHG